VVVEQFQPPGQLLRTAANQCNDLVGTEKTVPVNEPDDLAVALLKLHGGNFGSTVESG